MLEGLMNIHLQTWNLRGDVRKRYNIQGTGFKDCLASAFCLPCTISQWVAIE